MQAAINNIEEGKNMDDQHKSKMLARTDKQNEMMKKFTDEKRAQNLRT